MVKYELKTEIIIKEILKKSTVEKTSDDFTGNMMRHVAEAKPGWAKSYQPIISRQGWFIIGISTVLISAFIILAAILDSGIGTRSYKFMNDSQHYINVFSLYINSILSKLKIPFLFPLGIAFMIVMIGLDFITRKLLKLK